MAPEHPPQLIIFDSRFEDETLKGDLHYVEVPIGNLRVTWDAEREPANFQSVGGGVAYVFKTDGLQVFSRDSIPDDLGRLRYRWSEGLDEGTPWIMFILILPHGHTLVEAEPKPARAKICNDRFALYWVLKGDPEFKRTQVVCTLSPFEGNASSKLVELNRFCSGRLPPTTGSIEIEDSPRSTAKAIFISYAHEDNDSTDRSKRWVDRLTQFLQPLVEQDELTIWSDQDIELGEDWHAHIQEHLNGARAAVLLISPAFLASKYVRSSELPVLLRNAKERGVKIIPIIVRRSLFEQTKFKYPDPTRGPGEFSLASIQSSNSPTKPLSGMTEAEQDEVLYNVARALLKIATLPSQPSGAPRTFQEDISRIVEYAPQSGQPIQTRPEPLPNAAAAVYPEHGASEKLAAEETPEESTSQSHGTSWKKVLSGGIKLLIPIAIGLFVGYSYVFGPDTSMLVRDLDWEPRNPKPGEVVTFTAKFTGTYTVREFAGGYWPRKREIEGKRMARTFTESWSITNNVIKNERVEILESGRVATSQVTKVFDRPGSYTVKFSINIEREDHRNEIVRTITVGDN